MYALFYHRVTEPEIVYDIDNNRVLHGPVRQIKVVSNTLCRLDGVPYTLEPAERWQTLIARPEGGGDDRSSYRVFCAEHASSDFRRMQEAPWIETPADAEPAIRNRMDFFYLLQKSRFVDNPPDGVIQNESALFDIDAYRRRARYFSDPFGMFVAFGATTFAPNLLCTQDGKFLSGPLELALWTTMDVGSALYSPAAGKIYYGRPEGDNFRQFPGTGLLLAPVNYGHWHAQNLPALFALKQLIEHGIVAPDAVTIVCAKPEVANVDLLGHYLQLLNLRPTVIDPAKERIDAFAFDCTLLPSSCEVGAFHWSDYLARSLALLAENAARRDRVLFISRADVNNARGLVNEDEVLQALTDAGIAVERVVAARLSYREQRELFAEAALVIGTHGGGLTNAVYGGPRCAVLELNCDIIDNNRGWFHNLYALLGHPYAAINFPSIEHVWWAPFRADPDSVVATARRLLAARATSAAEAVPQG